MGTVEEMPLTIRFLTLVALIPLGLATAAPRSASLTAAPALRIARQARSGLNLLRDGGFEQPSSPPSSGWRIAAGAGRVTEREGRSATSAFFAERRSGDPSGGASQALELNRTQPAPLVVRGWSRAEAVSGSPDSDYSLYVDLVYTDGTPLWGQAVEFDCGTHDWQLQELLILPEKPVRGLTVHCLFREHTGRAWFDDVTLEELRPRGSELLFQGVPVERPRRSPVPPGVPEATSTGDGLSLVRRGNAVTSLRVDGRELAVPGPSGFLVRDVATDSDFQSFRDGSCPQLGLRLKSSLEGAPGDISVRGRLTDTTGRDRALTFLFALPLDAVGWQWGDDARRRRTIRGTGEVTNVSLVRCGSTGTMSLYPLAAVWNGRTGLAMAIDMSQAAQYRLAYHAGTKQFLIAYDFALVRETRRFPSAADFRFVIFRFDPAWGFRAAFEKFTRLFPAHFLARSRNQGTWMPFTDVSKVRNWRDFGFRYHEGDNNTAFDDANGILSFRYAEPMTWWMPMAGDLPRTLDTALRVREERATGPDGIHRRLALASKPAAMSRPDGTPALLFRQAPWCDGAVWSLNPNPDLPGPLNAATVHWGEYLRQPGSAAATTGVDGEYLDSLEGYVTADLNFRREHFIHTSVPLSYHPATRQPAIPKGLAVYELTRWLSDRVHRRRRLLFANSVPHRFTFLCPWLDVMGTETNWVHERAYAPPPDSQLLLWRTMAFRKPYLLLMNTDFDQFAGPMVERYFQRCLFYGFFPGMFSHNAADRPYWENPVWYNRDRPLFRKYVPLVRAVAHAGWQPVTRASCDNPAILVERFGPGKAGDEYLTLLNDSDRPQGGAVVLPSAAGAVRVDEMLSGSRVAPAAGRVRLQLAPQAALVLRIQGARSP